MPDVIWRKVKVLARLSTQEQNTKTRDSYPHMDLSI
jgi:hypothetical protein